MIAKYVMTNAGPIIFPDSFKHSDFLCFKPTSAGSVRIADCGVWVHGGSVSLNMQTRKEDAILISKAFFM